MKSIAMPALAALLGLTGCVDRNSGVVELAWVFVDRDGDAIYPGGVFSIDNERDSCDLRARSGNRLLRYDLRVQLEICDPACEAGCDDPDCLVIDPIRFPCNTARGTEQEVPASDEPYRFYVRAAIESNIARCVEPDPTCIAVPGPRDRKVTAGLVTDLQVYQIAVDITNSTARLDLEACGCV